MSARIPLVVVALVLAAPHGNSQAVIAEWAGAAEYDEFGSSVAAAGDVDGGGFAQIILAVPSDAQLVGGTLYSQWAVLNPAANPLGIQTAASLAVTIQP